MEPLHAVIAVVLAYLAGSIPFGLLIGFAKGVDIRTQGSGNIGATNCGRVLGKKWGITAFVLDVLKGLGPVVASGIYFGLVGNESIDAVSAGWWLGVGVAGVLGHVMPVWLKFKGGKGVATAFGTLLGFWPFLTLPALGTLLVWIVTVKVWRYVSLASICGAASLPIWLAVVAIVRDWPIGRIWPFGVVTLVLSTVVIVRHRSNISRLRAGTENKLGGKTRDSDSPIDEAVGGESPADLPPENPSEP